jgi:hypothetical protein|tara:strand:- start:1870 stop:2214 length:345 start_codon:yes stop_codon:yes gene_type:complete
MDTQYMLANDNLDFYSVGMLSLLSQQKRQRGRFAGKRVSSEVYDKYINDRVEKLRELYEKHEPDYEYYYQLPEGETDGRKAIRMELIIGEDISPFDLPDFEQIMPSIDNYIDEV